MITIATHRLKVPPTDKEIYTYAEKCSEKGEKLSLKPALSCYKLYPENLHVKFSNTD